MLAIRIALRYLFSKKSHNAVNILSLVSVVGVAVATAAMIIVLSVFNGFSDLAAGKLSRLDPDLMIAPVHGKIIDRADSIASVIASEPGVSLAAPQLREQALAVTADRQMPVTIQGITPEAARATDLHSIMLDGLPVVDMVDDTTSVVHGMPVTVLSVGVAIETGLRSGGGTAVNLYVPRRLGRINPANPMSAFRGDTLLVGGVYSVEQAEYDTDMMLVPLSTARRLLDYNNGEATSISVVATDPSQVNSLASRLSSILGPDYRVLDRLAQQQQAFNMIAVEKWVTLLMLAFILVITSFNIISAIYILRVEKEGNMNVLRAMGARPAMVRSIFAWQGRFITLAGGAIGLITGCGLTLLQQWGGVIKLSSGNPTLLAVDYYPVRLMPGDVAIVAGIVSAVALICSFIATRRS